MVENVWKEEIFVKGEMACTWTCRPYHCNINLTYDVFLNVDVCCVIGRGVDLNRNWSVDWGKKEEVSTVPFHLDALFLYTVAFFACK